LGRATVPGVYADGVQLEVGRSYVIREGSDVTIAACGSLVDEAQKAADLLAAEGISAEVIDCFSIQPFDEETLLASAAKTGRVVTVEDHSVYGGLGSTVAEVLARRQPTPCAFVGLCGTFGKSGSYEELLSYFHMDGPAIVEAVKTLMA